MHVFITDDAQGDLLNDWRFVAESSVESADRLVEELIERALKCGDYPLSAPVLGRTNLRRINFRSWAILYEIVGNQVEILRFIQGRGNPRRFDRADG